MLTDPIADMLTRIRNAHLALHKEVNVPRSKMKEALAAILKQEGYVEDVAIDDRNITITLKYQKGKAVISGLKRVSTPVAACMWALTRSPRCRTASAFAFCPRPAVCWTA